MIIARSPAEYATMRERERTRAYDEIEGCVRTAVRIEYDAEFIRLYLPPERGGRFGFESLNSDFRGADERQILFSRDAFDWVGLPIPPERG